MAVVRLPHPDSTFSKGRSPLVVEAPWVFSAMSSVPIRLGGVGGVGGVRGHLGWVWLALDPKFHFSLKGQF